MFLFIFLSNKLYKFIKKNKNNYSFYNKMNCYIIVKTK